MYASKLIQRYKNIGGSTFPWNRPPLHPRLLSDIPAFLASRVWWCTHTPMDHAILHIWSRPDKINISLLWQYLFSNRDTSIDIKISGGQIFHDLVHLFIPVCSASFHDACLSGLNLGTYTPWIALFRTISHIHAHTREINIWLLWQYLCAHWMPSNDIKIVGGWNFHETAHL